jgi:hypothetical protein
MGTRSVETLLMTKDVSHVLADKLSRALHDTSDNPQTSLPRVPRENVIRYFVMLSKDVMELVKD